MGSVNIERISLKPDYHRHRTLIQLRDAGFHLRTWCTNCGDDQICDIDWLIQTRGSAASPWDRMIECKRAGCHAYGKPGRCVFKAANPQRGIYYRLSRYSAVNMGRAGP